MRRRPRASPARPPSTASARPTAGSPIGRRPTRCAARQSSLGERTLTQWCSIAGSVLAGGCRSGGASGRDAPVHGAARLSGCRPDPHHRAVRAGRPGRYPGARHRRSARQAARAERHHREPRRRRRQHRDRGGRARQARRLYAAALLQLAGRQSAALQERAVRSGQGFRADLAARHLAQPDAGEAGFRQDHDATSSPPPRPSPGN